MAATGASLSTHVLDTAGGRPAAGVAVRLEATDGTVLAEGVTDTDGRVGALAADLPTGDLRLRFDTGAWYAARGEVTFYPEVAVTFTVAAGEHHHVPLLLSPYGYSTYRGS
ncbi:5-hydroxyisourate hydrolase [Nocardioides flavus (ex Wang et al. 2016)]|uniref:5-hydroxyisourate hydrolase n=1 Tax=Nocardioides flavus (ex Wang et al. 2016) TaxID=2058780 RepID=A0ABQ3HLS3_9ACTN|nr:hydroxyisourate hydrolase [Nocardioides flavus (ex Wang et al. 2016)]GHE17084.1 5-hydroxyisourate hydrolase [Nocardioides flavus (ex Wang et al. 2016)]